MTDKARSASSQSAIILFAHGARDPAWRRPFDAIALAIKSAQPQAAVEIAFLELMEPRLPQVAQDLYLRGNRQLLVIPVFLSQSGHVMRDLPTIVSQIVATHPGLAISVGPAIGEAQSVINAIAATCLEQALTNQSGEKIKLGDQTL